jgi:sigma54-dependent transcription regulator
MTRPALFDLLQDFGSDARIRQIEPPPLAEEPAGAAHRTAEIDIAALIADEVVKAEVAVTERLAALYEATLQAERDSHAAERDELRRSFGSEAGALIEARLSAMQTDLVELTTSTAARILGSLLSDELQKRAIEGLSTRISEAIHDAEALRIRVAGPQSLCEPLAAALGEHAASVEFSERASFDLSVSIDSSIYETRLAEWADELARVLA